MKKDVFYFLTKLLFFTLPLVCILVYIESGLSRVPNSYSTKRKNLEKHLSEINILVLGNSWTAAGINPEFFRMKGYNLAYGGQSLWYDVSFVRKYIAQMPQLKAVIITISYFSLGYQLDESVEKWREAFYYRFWGIQPQNRNLTYWDHKLNYSLIRLYDKERVLKALIKNFKVDFNAAQESGWVVSTGGREEISDSSGSKRARVHNNMIRQNNYPTNIRHLEILLSELAGKKVSAVFINPPVFQTYYKYINVEIRQKNNEVMEDLCRRYKCHYLDYLEDKRFSIEDFNNNDHLNRRGAEKFSRILDAEVIAQIGNGN